MKSDNLLHKAAYRVARALQAQRVRVSILATLIEKRITHARSVVFIATPSHGNLGDQAIVRAQRQFFADMGISKELLEIPRSQYERSSHILGSLIKSTDVIVIDGGGNVGTLWPEENKKMNTIISSFSGNPVIVFPQTAFFETSEVGEQCKREVACAYAANPHLLFFARDRATYNIVKEITPSTTCLLVPDMVLYLNESQRNLSRSGVLLCLREDKERTLDKRARDALASLLEDKGFRVSATTTVIKTPLPISHKNRANLLEEKWAEFSSAELVITDRLHGMIFSAITGTPCIALDNVSHKVSQGYEWIKEIQNIRIASNLAEVQELIDIVLLVGALPYHRSALNSYYDKMKAAVRNVCD